MKGKSAAAGGMFPKGWRDQWFSDDLPLSADSKTRMELTAGTVLNELTEMAGLDRSASGSQKAAISRTHDRARMAYDRRTSVIPRRFALVATANDLGAGVLPDDTENTRWVSVRIPETSTPQRIEWWLNVHRRPMWKRAVSEYKAWKDKVSDDGDEEEQPPWFLTPTVRAVQDEVNRGLTSTPHGVEALVQLIEEAATSEPTPKGMHEWLARVEAFGEEGPTEVAQRLSAGTGNKLSQDLAKELDRRKWVSKRSMIDRRKAIRWGPPPTQ